MKRFTVHSLSLFLLIIGLSSCGSERCACNTFGKVISPKDTPTPIATKAIIKGVSVPN